MSRVKYPPGMGSAPPESRLKELLLPPPMVGLKMGALGTTAALTVAETEESGAGHGGSKDVGGSQKGIWTLQPPVEPSCISPRLLFEAPLPQRGAGAPELSQEGQAEIL